MLVEKEKQKEKVLNHPHHQKTKMEKKKETKIIKQKIKLELM